jgi:hypothetical protein
MPAFLNNEILLKKIINSKNIKIFYNLIIKNN